MNQQLVLKRTYQINALIRVIMIITVLVYTIIIEVDKYHNN
jgi:hypothetical protein